MRGSKPWTVFLPGRGGEGKRRLASIAPSGRLPSLLKAASPAVQQQEADHVASAAEAADANPEAVPVTLRYTGGVGYKSL
jgi:hypothetical protein